MTQRFATPLVFLLTLAFWIGLLVDSPAQPPNPATDDAKPEAIAEVIALLQDRLDGLQEPADQAKVQSMIAALRKLTPRAGKFVDIQSISPQLLREKFKGRATMKDKLLTLSYDFKVRNQLQDFELEKAKPTLVPDGFKIDGAEIVRHIAVFKSVTVTCLLGMGNRRNTHLRLTGGISVVGWAEFDRWIVDLYANGRSSDNKTTFDRGYATPSNILSPLPVELKVADGRVKLRFGEAKIDAVIPLERAGRVEFLGADGDNIFRKVTIAGELDAEWAKQFFSN